MRFFDSLPTNKSRLLTFRCPYYKTRPNTKHYMTVAWKPSDPKKAQEVSLLSENVAYVGKPLALFPSAIESHKKDTFPLGTMFTTCSCMPERNGKICYVSTDIVDISNMSIDKPAETSKIQKKLENDVKVTNRLLIQIYDVLEDIQKEQGRQKKEWKKVFEEQSQQLIQENKAIEEKVTNISKVLIQLPNYLEERFQTDKENTSNKTKTYQDLIKEVNSLENSLKNIKQEEKQETKVKIVEKSKFSPKKEKEEKYLDLFGDEASSNLVSVLEEPKAQKTKVAKTKGALHKSFSVTQVLNTSALARAKGKNPDEIFMMDNLNVTKKETKKNK